MLKPILITIGTFFLGMLATLGVTNLVHGNNETTARVYGDWRLNCPPATAKPSPCTLTQDIMQNGTGTTLVHIELAQSEGEKRLAVVVPHGVLIPPGLGLGIGSAQIQVLKYQTCDQVGCFVVQPLNDATLDALREADSGRIVVVSRDGQEVAFPYSLKGFSTGMRMLAWESFRRGTWVGRQLP